MRFLSKIYDKTLEWTRHRYALRYLAFLSFIEASIFPVPPDVMLAPMSLANPQSAFRFAGFTVIFSVIGGMLGYAIGFFAFSSIALPFIKAWGYEVAYQTVLTWFQQYGFWAVLLSGVTPMPYKLFTICSGMMQFSIGLFLAASIVGRSIRFFVVAAIMRWGGERMEKKLRQMIDLVGWGLVFLVGLGSCVRFLI